MNYVFLNINFTEWLFVRARTDRILAIRTAYDHVTMQVASREMTRENVRNARETEGGVLDALEIDNSSSGEVMFTIAESLALSWCRKIK